MFNPVRMQLKLTAPPERVFEALMDATALKVWFCEHAEITPEYYDFWGRFTPEAPDHDAGHHAMVSRIAPREAVYDWRLRGAATQVTIKLLPRDEGTILTLRQVATETTDDSHYHLEDFWFLSMENLRRYLDGKPCEDRVDFSNPMKGDIRHETVVDAPASRVFEVLIRPDELDRWIATKATVVPETGGTFDIGWGEFTAGVKIVELIPDQKLSITVPEDDYYGNKNRTHTIQSWVLEERDGKTRLTFTHSGFDVDEDVSGIYTGWRSFLNWVRSAAEYGANWQPPLVVLPPDAIGYAASILNAQDEIVDELKAPIPA